MELPGREVVQASQMPTLEELRLHRVVVVVPAYNEGRFIGSVVVKLFYHPVMVIVVDDGSSDDTAWVAELAGARVVRHGRNKGKGEALNTGLCEARLLEPEAIVVIDGDGQHLPEQLPLLVGPILAGVADIVVGSRYLEKTCQVPPHRLLGHWFFNILTGLTSGISVSDSQSGYRAFSPRAFNTELFRCSEFAVESEMQFLAHEHGLRMVEVPIIIRYQDKPKRSVWRQGWNVLNGVLRLTGQYRPLLFFGLPGALSMMAGVGWSLWVMDRLQFINQLATYVRELLFITGLVMFVTGMTLHSVRSLLINILRDQRQAKGGE